MRSFVALFLCAVLTAPAQTPTFKLTIDEIMRGPGLFGHAPRAIRWSGDSQKLYFQWKRASDPLEKEFDTYVANRDGSGLRKLSDEEAKLAPPVQGQENREKTRVVYSEQGDLFIYERATGTRRRLTKTADAESNPRFTKDGRRVAFVRGGNLYTLALEDGMLEQWTDIRAATPPGGAQAQQRDSSIERKGTDSQEAVKKEERALLEVVGQRARKREDAEAKRKKENPRKPFNLAARQTAGNILLAPDEKIALATITETSADSKSTVVPNYVTESAYTETIPSRLKVGDTQTRPRLAILDVVTGESKWIESGSDQAVQWGPPQFNEEGDRLAVSARSADNKERWIFAVDRATGKCRTLVQFHDDAWINGPGSLTLGWLGDDKTLYYQAEADGWSHLYTIGYDGGEPKQITSGKWEVLNTQLSRDKKRFWLTTSEESLFEHHFYSTPADGGARTKISAQPGRYTVTPSPDEQMLAVLYSYTNKPPELYLMENKPGAKMVKVSDSPAPEFWTYSWIDTPIVKIPARDGAQVPAHLYKPKNWKSGGPAVIFVHGAGYLQNVDRGWSSYAQSYMFHHLLMEKGYTVVDIDYRGSAGYGRDWRAAIYRHMGGKDLDDQVDAARWLAKEHGVDPKRIGIYGGSYGGFITLMAMFTQPGVFAAGAALRPVTDWAHYNHGYTSNILNIPQKDLDAYKQSSPIYHAAGLRGALLICHGMVDVNVHFQDTVRLVQKLIELRKENWELAVYPVEDHGFIQPTSWADEYKRIFALFEKNLTPRGA